ncbi:hypothetical protein ACSVDA_14215 [Cytobacillus sp. Hm23]
MEIASKPYLSLLIAFAYPYGAYNLAGEKTVGNIHQMAFTTEEGLNSEGHNPLRIKRININDNLSGDDIIRKIKSLR